MSKTAERMKAADLLVHGTFALRRALDRFAQPVRHAAPAEPQPAPAQERGGVRRPTMGAAASRSHG